VSATASVVATLRRLWQHRHPRRRQYLLVAVALIAVAAAFLVNDLRLLPIRP
jgi:hypothetical protein